MVKAECDRCGYEPAQHAVEGRVELCRCENCGKIYCVRCLAESAEAVGLTADEADNDGVCIYTHPMTEESWCPDCWCEEAALWEEVLEE